MFRRRLRPDTARFTDVGVIAIDRAAHVNAKYIALLQDVVFKRREIAAAADRHMHPVNLASGPGDFPFVDPGELALSNTRLGGTQHRVDRALV